MKFFFFLLALAIFLFATGAFAADYPRDIALTWTNPTLYDDDTPIQVGDLRGTRIICSRHSGEVVIDEEVPNLGDPGNGEGNVFTAMIPRPGTYTCTAYAVTIDDTQSDASNSAAKKYTGKPKPPFNINIP
jgi:hypothetical protein